MEVALTGVGDEAGLGLRVEQVRGVVVGGQAAVLVRGGLGERRGERLGERRGGRAQRARHRAQQPARLLRRRQRLARAAAAGQVTNYR